jgi:uncharacterized protein
MYDWDEAKRRKNSTKHGVDFTAMARFDWNTAVVIEDIRRDYGEPRFSATGRIGLRLHVVVYTRRRSRLRIISLRRANRRDVKRWERCR